MKKILLISIVALVMSGCWPLHRGTSKESAARINRSRLEKLDKGMAKGETLRIMGEGYFCRDLEGYCCVRNPAIFAKYNYQKSRIIQFDNDKSIEIIYYFTQAADDSCGAAEEECTPLVFMDGILIGWGDTFLQKTIQNEGQAGSME